MTEDMLRQLGAIKGIGWMKEKGCPRDCPDFPNEEPAFTKVY
jgi:hypothetical protein